MKFQFGDCVSASTQMAPNTQAPYEEERQPRQGHFLNIIMVICFNSNF